MWNYPRGFQIPGILHTIQLFHAPVLSAYSAIAIWRPQSHRQFFDHHDDHRVSYPGYILPDDHCFEFSLDQVAL
jgi:hypothetical protein